MHKTRLFALLFACLPLLYGQACAQEVADEASAAATQDEGTTIDALRLEIQLDRELHAIGDAELHQASQTIYGDRIDYDMLNNELHAIGNTRIVMDENVFAGPELRLQLDNREGEMKEPVFRMKLATKPATAHPSPSMIAKPAEYGRGDAKTILFEGPTKERLEDVRYTTCPEGVDDWFMKAKDLELDHYTETGTATHARIDFMGVPIMYTPWIDFPFKHQRKSGFLLPTFGATTRNGIDFTLPYYWNIAPNMDATLSPRYLALRGLQLNGEFRYLEPNYSGTDIIQYLPNDNSSNRTRFLANLKHVQDFGHGFSGGFDYERVSDSKYFADLSSHIITTSQVNLPQQAHLDYASNGWYLNGLVQKYQTLDKVSYPYQLLPQLTLSRADTWGMVNSNLYGQWSRYDKSANAPLTVTGNRVVLNPSVSLPLTEPYGYLTPKLGLHYTKYDLAGNTDFTLHGQPDNYRSQSRTLPVLSVDGGLYFDREFKVVRNKYLQTLEPRLFYVYVPYTNQDRLPVFDTGLSDLNMSSIFSENQFVGNDRFNDANQLTMAITSRIIDGKTGEQRLSGTLAQRFYFSDQKVTMPGGTPRTNTISDLLAAFSARLTNHWNFDGEFQYDTNQSEFMKRNISARYTPEQGKVFNLAYRFTRSYLEQVDASTEWPLGNRWFGLGQLSYSLKQGDRHPIQALGGVEYDAGCWQTRAVVQRITPATITGTTPVANYAFYVQLVLGGLSSIGTNPLDLLKRNIPGYINSSWVPDTSH